MLSVNVAVTRRRGRGGRGGAAASLLPGATREEQETVLPLHRDRSTDRPTASRQLND